MKRILLIVIALLFSFCFAQTNSQSEYYLGEKYQKEMKETIEKEILKSKKELINLEKQIKNEKDQIEKQILIDDGANLILFDFYMKLIETTGKYINIEDDILETDFNCDLEIFIYPYLKTNNIDIKNIKKFLDEIEKREKKFKT